MNRSNRFPLGEVDDERDEAGDPAVVAKLRNVGRGDKARSRPVVRHLALVGRRLPSERPFQVRTNDLESGGADQLVDTLAHDLGARACEPAFVGGAHELVPQVGADVRHRYGQGIRQALELSLAVTKGLLRAPPLCDVAGEAARVHEVSVPEIAAGADEHVLDRPVFGAKARFEIVNGLAAGQPRQDVGDDLLVDMELGDGASHVLVRLVAEELELRAVGPQDGAVRTHAVQPDGGVLDEIPQLLLAPAQRLFFSPQLAQRIAQRLFDLFAQTDLLGNRLGVLRRSARFVDADDRFGRTVPTLPDHVRVRAADLLNRRWFFIEGPHGIRAQQAE